MKTNYFEIRGRLWGIALILSLPLIGHAQSFDMSQIETKIRAFQIQNSKTASTEKLEILDAKKKNKMPLSPTGNFEKQNPAEKLLKPQWFSPEFQKALTSGGVGTGGGDDDGAKFRAYAALGVDQLKDRFTADQSALIKEALSKARILMVDEKQFAVLGEVTQDSVALNNPETGIVTVSRDRWHQVERKGKAMSKTISTHEVLSLVKMESTGQYDHSSEILVDEMKKQKPSQVKVLFSKYADSTRTGYDWDSALEICERVKTDNEKKYYLVYCSFYEKYFERHHHEDSISYGLIVYGVGDPNYLKWKTVFSSLKIGRGGQYHETYNNQADAKDACFETLKDNINSQPTWIEPHCVVNSSADGFYYEIQTQNPLAK